MRKNRSIKKYLKRHRSVKRSYGGIMRSLPTIHEDKNVDDMAKMTAALAARGIILDNPSYDTMLHIVSTSVVLDTIFKVLAKATKTNEYKIRKAYSVLNIFDIV